MALLRLYFTNSLILSWLRLRSSRNMHPLACTPMGIGCLLLMTMLAGSFFPRLAFGQEPAEARAFVFCGDEEDPERAEKTLTGLFGRHDTWLFNLACDHFEVIDVATVQELADVLAISSPQAQAETEALVAVQISPDPECSPGGKATGFGFTSAGSRIDLSIAIRTKQPPPIELGTIPGIAIMFGVLVVSLDPPNETMPGESNYASAAAGLLDGLGQSLGLWGIEVTEGRKQLDIDRVISLDMITTGEDMRFSKGAEVDVGVFALEPCTGGESVAQAKAFLDPVFAFDQERFDAEQGANSFPLAEYYEILLSPNLNELISKDSFEN